MRKTIFRKLLLQNLSLILCITLFFLFSRNLAFPLNLIPWLATATLTAILLALAFSRSLTGRIERVDGYLKQVTKESASFHFIGDEKDELGTLENTVSELSVALRKQDNLRRQEEGLLAAVLSSMDEGVIVIDSDGNIVLANRKAGEIFGSSLEGHPVTHMVRDPVLLKFIDHSIKEQKAMDFELETGPGSTESMAVSVSPFLNREKISGSVITLYDISWLKKLESMRKDFVANVSHELKTPLTAIQGFSETLISGALKDTEGSMRFLKKIESNASRMSGIVSDLLTLSNIELGKTTFRIGHVSLKDVIDNVTTALPPDFKKRDVTLAVSIDSSLSVLADADRLKQIIVNLLDNAFKYTEKGEISVAATPDRQKIEISVSDTGIGIPRNKLSRVGERFYRVDPARSRELGGTGLGLAIVKHLVISMNGEFLISSEPGKGTKVTFTLPQAEEPQQNGGEEG